MLLVLNNFIKNLLMVKSKDASCDEDNVNDSKPYSNNVSLLVYTRRADELQPTVHSSFSYHNGNQHQLQAKLSASKSAKTSINDDFCTSAHSTKHASPELQVRVIFRECTDNGPISSDIGVRTTLPPGHLPLGNSADRTFSHSPI